MKVSTGPGLKTRGTLVLRQKGEPEGTQHRVEGMAPAVPACSSWELGNEASLSGFRG